MKKLLLGAGAVLAPGLAYAELTVPTIGTTDLYSGGTAVLALMAVVAGICIVISLFKKARG